MADIKKRLDAIAKSVADQISKWYHDAPIYAYCDMYEYNITQEKPDIVPITWVCEGTDDFGDLKFKAGFEHFVKKAGLNWTVMWWAMDLGRSLSERDRPVYKTTILVKLDTK